MYKKEKLFLIIAIFALFLMPSAALAGPADLVSITHRLIGFQVLDNQTELVFSVKVANDGADPVAGLTLSFLPMAIVTDQEILLTMGDLEPGGSAEMTFSFQTVTVATQEEMGQFPLSWSVWGTGADGAPFQALTDSFSQVE